MKKIVIMLLIVTTLNLVSSGIASSQQPAEVVADVLLVRPLTLAATIVGTALFIVSLPFAIPSGSVNGTARALVGIPFSYTFVRPIGDFDHFSSYPTASVGASGYYANGVYYAYPPGAYVMVNPSLGSVSQPPRQDSFHVTPERMFVYPRHGQSDQQQKIDQDARNRLAIDKTGYDPILSNAKPDSKRRADYQHALATCLDSRGYSVR